MTETKEKSGAKSAQQPKSAAEAKAAPKVKPMPSGMHSVTPHIL